jgi:hypothetical protein
MKVILDSITLTSTNVTSNGARPVIELLQRHLMMACEEGRNVYGRSVGLTEVTALILGTGGDVLSPMVSFRDHINGSLNDVRLTFVHQRA